MCAILFRGDSAFLSWWEGFSDGPCSVGKYTEIRDRARSAWGVEERPRGAAWCITLGNVKATSSSGAWLVLSLLFDALVAGPLA